MISIYAPAALFSVAQGAILPVVPLTARELGASVAFAAFTVALLGIGLVAAALPAGALVARLGERTSMLLAAAASAVALVGAALAPTAVVLALCILVLGLGTAVWSLARMSFLAAAAPAHLRARVMSTLGGVGRIGTFIGPFAGAAGSALIGGRGAYVVAVVATAAAAVVLLLLPDPELPEQPVTGPAPGVLTIIRGHLRVLATLGVAALLVQAVRQSRQTILPLWCEQLGLDAAAAGLVAGISGGVDMLLFYPAGAAMDRFGRRAIAVPAMLTMGLGHALLPWTDSFVTIAAAGVVMGLGNGMSAGLVMTLGADNAPPGARAQFLGAWRLVTDSGVAAGPVVVGAVAGAASLAVAGTGVAVLSVVAALALARMIPGRLSGPATR